MNNMDDEDLLWLVGGVVLLAAVVVFGGWASWWIAGALTSAAGPPAGPFGSVGALKRHEASWPIEASIVAAVLAVLLLVLVVIVVVRLPHSSVDRAAKRLPREGGLKRYLNAAGPPIGRLVTAGRPQKRSMVCMTTEDQGIVVAGPRVGKTTTIAVPAGLSHGDGPMVVTSNKRDVADLLTTARKEFGRVWLFDPQGIATPRGVPSWTWNPLDDVHNEFDATSLASVITGAQRAPGERADAYFTPAGERLLASMMFIAAKTGKHTLVDIYEWISEPDSPKPMALAAAQGLRGLMVTEVENARALPDKQRAGVYGTALGSIGFIIDPFIQSWVTPKPGTDVFRPGDLHSSGDTLISLSREGQGSAGPLVAALTAKVLQLAEEAASRMPGGRLEKPLLGLLDEAANVCRWKELPDLYSHYGSRGIVLLSLFQSWAQMEAAFGKEGAEKLWSSSNVRVYAGGVSDPTFLRRISDLGGEYDALTRSTTSSRHGPSRSRSTQRRAILDVATLGALPAGRAVVLLSLARPIVVQLVPFWEGPHADRVPKFPAEGD